NQDDLVWWRDRHPDERIRLNDIRNFDLLAARRTPELARLGALRMDVDSLGTLFQGKDHPLTLTQRMAASDALSLFFEGYLRELCLDLERRAGREHSLYLLYGGGDDLFMVGEWDLMPGLANEIRDAFSDYTQGQMSISAG